MLSVSSNSVAHRLLGLPSIFDNRKTVYNETLWQPVIIYN